MLPIVAMLMPNWMNPEYLLNWLGDWALWGTLIVVFIECGVLFPILPGDSLLFAVGLFIAQGTIHVPLWLACVLLTIAAFLGNVSGYYIGRFLGTSLFKNPNARILKPKYIEQTHDFFERYGPRALVMARFVPIVRTFITIVAGAGRMDPRKFFLWTGVGAVIWAPGITLLGHALGNVEFIHKNLEAALVLLVLISLIPMVVEYFLAKRRNRNNTGSSGGSAAAKHAAPKHAVPND
ncbi:DedA family protein [Kribbella kalugense]|uniref:DedA family protein n=1 Tax=Kribbella kalugense TaxID=2512221 RepID=UPI001EDE988D|nr:DedA family protein [Kribbella kalugense]